MLASTSILFCITSDKAFTAIGEFTVPSALMNLILDSPLTSKVLEIAISPPNFTSKPIASGLTLSPVDKEVKFSSWSLIENFSTRVK